MGTRHPNPCRVKKHRLYTVEELAAALGLHKHTIRRWTKCGLQPIDDQRPMVFRGVEVVEFLRKRRTAGKRPCGPGQMYCFKCREPKFPDGLIADLEVATMMYRRVNPANLKQTRGNLEITVRQAQAHIADSPAPKLSGDFKGPA
jgi:Helix-turn-helix domain